MTYSDGSVYLLGFDSSRNISAQCLLKRGASLAAYKPKWSFDNRFLALYADDDVCVFDVHANQHIEALRIPNSSRVMRLTEPALDEFAWAPSSVNLAILLIGSKTLKMWGLQEIQQSSETTFVCSHTVDLKNELNVKRYSFDNDISWINNNSEIIIPCLKDSLIVSFSNNRPDISTMKRGAGRAIFSNDGLRSIFEQSYTVGAGGWGRQLALSLYVDKLADEKTNFILGFPAGSSDAKIPNDAPFKYWSCSVPPAIMWGSDGSRIYCGFVTIRSDRELRSTNSFSVFIWDGDNGNVLYENTVVYPPSSNIFYSTLSVLIADISISPKGQLVAMGENIRIEIFGYIWSFSVVCTKTLPY